MAKILGDATHAINNCITDVSSDLMPCHHTVTLRWLAGPLLFLCCLVGLSLITYGTNNTNFIIKVE